MPTIPKSLTSLEELEFRWTHTHALSRVTTGIELHLEVRAVVVPDDRALAVPDTNALPALQALETTVLSGAFKCITSIRTADLARANLAVGYTVPSLTHFAQMSPLCLSRRGNPVAERQRSEGQGR